MNDNKTFFAADHYARTELSLVCILLNKLRRSSLNNYQRGQLITRKILGTIIKMVKQCRKFRKVYIQNLLIAVALLISRKINAVKGKIYVHN